MPHVSKRKHEELDDSDDEEPSFGRQILPVANLPEDFDGIPEDGLQYLFTVRCGNKMILIICFLTALIDGTLDNCHR
jgi:hypothetical protein